MRSPIGTTAAFLLLLGASLSCDSRYEKQSSSTTCSPCVTKLAAPGEQARTDKTEPESKPVTMAGSGPRPKDNSFCHVCHDGLQKELITKVHAKEDILCVDCHGPSTLHMEDEMLMTKPDVLLGRSEVEPFCRQCHGPHEEPDEVEEFREKWKGRDLPNGRVVSSRSICTDCHGTHNIGGKAADRKKTTEGQQKANWVTLFNGKDLSGWKPTGDAKWTVEGGNLVGTQGENNAPGDLLTEAVYKDFLLAVTYRAEWPCNTGVWFRYQSPGQAYQADILEYKDPVCYSGSLYCPGKKFLALNTDKGLVDRDGWNTISVRAEGDHIQIWINGHQVADVHDDSSDAGHIGFQVHPGDAFGAMKIIVSEAKIQPLGETS